MSTRMTPGANSNASYSARIRTLAPGRAFNHFGRGNFDAFGRWVWTHGNDARRISAGVLDRCPNSLCHECTISGSQRITLVIPR